MGGARLRAGRLGARVRGRMFVSAMMGAEATDQEYIAWMLGGAVPLADSKYPYWQMFLSRADDIEEDIAPFQRPNGAACS